ncbi:Branched-chain amino acid transport system 2 carrier protein [Clostridium liquoris]|jgi:LIVCS family branched-chain amino acid:cation transporter|uniref:Branched-chain amino acid transport system carrier protein n=1 Tax=Clostridium liquoris TaxID=1289519 RepID=A0A2T0B175_9CLOT|nr:branched-chain amino acid transport system II carrier protein [Clostridium liquoris]PRR77342.1 Branched-chain amino acid transport system 2 carrier protein [Clostridium liquoris]
MKKSNKDAFIIGLALFAMFFGSGNLIFPPYLGKAAGSKYFISIIGFIMTGVGLPLMGILACAKINGTFKDMSLRVGKVFSIIATTSIVLAIGPMLAIPRTAATTYELSVHPIFPNVGIVPSIIIYFIINLAFVLKPSSIVDNIGKILTPILLLLLLTIIVKGVISPIGTIVNTNFQHVFSNSLIEGYQTMDAIASVIFASIVLSSVKDKGYTKTSDIIKMTSISGIVAVIGLGVIYGGLMYLGSQTSSIIPGDIGKTALVTEIVKRILGYSGNLFLGAAVALACLTTSIGLTSSAAKYFEGLSKDKLSYRTNSIIITIWSILMATMGVDKIVVLSGPILQILYPIVIVLVILTLLGVNNNSVISATVYTTLIISILDNMAPLGIHIKFIENFISLIPLSKIGFVWVIPSIIAFIISYLYANMKKAQI